MKITKYPQSCFVFEDKGSKIMIDPGSFFAQKYKAEDFLDVKAVLITHNHADHMHIDTVKVLYSKGVKIFGNPDVAKALRASGVEVSEAGGNSFTVAGFEIEPVLLDHCKLPFCSACNTWIRADNRTKEGKCRLHPDVEVSFIDGPPNTGFHINHLFFHSGDSTDNKFNYRNGSVPIVGPTINYEKAWQLVKNAEIKLIVPIHYDHPAFFERDPHEFTKKNPGLDVEVKILKDGESIEIG
jgi:L-ascorbate metabolism protein UlaG (beta-lactamase superfamily)